MTQTVNRRRPAGAQSAAERELRDALDDGSLTEIEVAWSDPFGHAAGKRIPAAQFLDRALGTGFAFCEASLGWNTDGTVIDSLRLTNWGGGYPTCSPCRIFRRITPAAVAPRVGHVISDIVAHDRSPSLLDPRAVLRGCWHRLAALGYTAKIGVEFEFYLLKPDGSPISGRHPRLLAGERQRPRSAAQRPVRNVERVHGVWRASRPSTAPARSRRTWSTPTRWTPPTTAARLKYAAKEVARRHGKIASFMPKPFTEHSGSSQHLHISLWRGDEPAFAPDERLRERTGPARDRGPARAPAVDHAVRRALGQRLPTVRPGLVRARTRYVEPRQPQRRGALAGRGRPVRHPDRTAQRRLRRQPVLVDRVGAGGGDRGAGGQAQRAAGTGGNLYTRGRTAA